MLQGGGTARLTGYYTCEDFENIKPNIQNMRSIPAGKKETHIAIRILHCPQIVWTLFVWCRRSIYFHPCPDIFTNGHPVLGCRLDMCAKWPNFKARVYLWFDQCLLKMTQEGSTFLIPQMAINLCSNSSQETPWRLSKFNRMFFFLDLSENRKEGHCVSIN